MTDRIAREAEEFERNYRRSRTCKETEPEKFEQQSREDDERVNEYLREFLGRDS